MSIKSLQDHGFINYFGKQRFGRDETSVQIGIALLKKQYMKAVQLLLTPNRDTEHCESESYKAKRNFVNTYDIETTLKMMPSHRTRERIVLKALKRYTFTEDGCRKALSHIPHNMRIFYISSFASLVWNEVISRRILNFGFVILQGDLVICKEKSSEIHKITDKDVKSNIYSFADLVFPTPGVDFKMVDNITASYFNELLMHYGIDWSCFHKHDIAGNIKSNYRSAICRPLNLEWTDLTPNSKDIKDILLTFELPSSCYATILIRELLHGSSSNFDI